MASKLKNTIAAQLNAAQVAISNTLADAEIARSVAEYGYDTARLEEGRSLHAVAVSAVNAQTAAAGAQRNATTQVKSAEARARGAYQALAQVARAIFVNGEEELARLGLTGPMPRDTAGFLTAAHTLFDNALGVESVKTALAGYGYSEDKLQSERAAVAAFDQANQAQEAAIGAAQQSTQVQEAALKALQEWLAQYVKIARVALRGKRQLLEKLGIVARTTKTAAQRAAPKKAAATRAAKKAQTP